LVVGPHVVSDFPAATGAPVVVAAVSVVAVDDKHT
jgi:hypothetical protein